jgi:hypothetical protein
MSSLRLFKPGLLVLAALLVSAIACGGASPTSPANLSSFSITVLGTGVTTYTYTRDIAPILSVDCVPCHGGGSPAVGLNFSSYSGVLAAVTVGSQNSLLVKAVQPAGTMYAALSGNRTAKVQLIYDWVVNSRAAQ